MTVTGTDGTVIHARFGNPDAMTFPEVSITCQTLYADRYAVLMRLTHRLGMQAYIQHVASGVGLDG